MRTAKGAEAKGATQHIWEAKGATQHIWEAKGAELKVPPNIFGGGELKVPPNMFSTSQDILNTFFVILFWVTLLVNWVALLVAAVITPTIIRNYRGWHKSGHP